MLSKNVKLKYLDITHNPIGTWQIILSDKALRESSNHSLNYFFYSKSNIRKKQDISIQKTLLYNKLKINNTENKEKLISIQPQTINNKNNLKTGFFLNNNLFSLHLTIINNKNANFCAIKKLILSSLHLKSKNLSFLTYENFPNLKELILCNNKLKNYKILDFKLSNQLEYLDLSFNQFIKIPKNLLEHKNLIELNLSKNKITQVNFLIDLLKKSFKNIRKIDLSGNWINSISLHSLDDHDFHCLEEFLIDNNLMIQIKEIVYRCFFFKSIQLDVSNFNLDSLPNDFVYLNNYLILLNLSRNLFKKSPLQLRHLNKLQQIVIKSNKIKKVENVFVGNCVASPRIIVNSNEFRNNSISSLKRESSTVQSIQRKLTVISVQNRPVLAAAKSVLTATNLLPKEDEECLDDEPCNLNLSLLNNNNNNNNNNDSRLSRREISYGKDISSELSMIDLKNTQKYKQVKILHVGLETQLPNYLFNHLNDLKNVHHFINHHNNDDDDDSSNDLLTNPCNCSSTHKNYKFITFELYELPVTKLAMWNFCGPSKTQLKLFIHDKAIYILYFNINNNFEIQIIKYLQIIQSTCQNPYVILVGKDNRDSENDNNNQFELNQQDFIENLNNQINILKNKGFSFISYILLLNQSKESIQQLLQYIHLIIKSNHDDDIGIHVNTRNKDLIQLISEESNYTIPPVISYSDLSIMARSCCIENFDDPKPIVRYLNNIGQILYIDDQNLGLTNFIVLNRDWIVNATEELFSAQLDKPGLLPLHDIKKVWKSPCFPPTFLEIIISILEKHEIIISIYYNDEIDLLNFPYSLEDNYDAIKYQKDNNKIIIPNMEETDYILDEQSGVATNDDDDESHKTHDQELANSQFKELNKKQKKLKSNYLLIPSLVSPFKAILFDIWPSLQDFIEMNNLHFHPQPEIIRTVSFRNIVPHDFISRLFVRLFYITNPIRFWKNGILVSKNKNLCLIEKINSTDISIRFRCCFYNSTTASASSSSSDSSDFDQKYILPPFIRVIMETIQQLLGVYRVSHKILISYLCPSVGINDIFHLTKNEIYQDLVSGKYFVPGKDSGEQIFYREIAPDVVSFFFFFFQLSSIIIYLFFFS